MRFWVMRVRPPLRFDDLGRGFRTHRFLAWSAIATGRALRGNGTNYGRSDGRDHTNRLVRRDLQSMGWMSARLDRVRPLLCRGAFMALRVARRQAARSVGRTRRSQANELGVLARAASLERTRASRRRATARLLCEHGRRL